MLAYRARVHDLEHPVPASRCGVLSTGVQDTPPGTTAHLALGARVNGTSNLPSGLALVHSLRGTMHMHRDRDVSMLASALRPDHSADLLAQTHGRFFADLPSDTTIGEAYDEVAYAMASVMSDGVRRSKGVLSTELNLIVSERLRPWCSGCRVHHVHDGLFRLASLPAGLRLVANGDGSAHFVAGARPSPVDVTASRRELTRRFLRLCGPATHRTMAAWLGLTPAAANRWWDLIAGDTTDVTVDGRRYFMHREDLAAAGRAPTPTAVHLLPPYDPWVEVCDREVLVPEASTRKRIWSSAANPGLLLAGGEIAGTWRRRAATITVTPLLPLATKRLDAIEPPDGARVVVDSR